MVTLIISLPPHLSLILLYDAVNNGDEEGRDLGTQVLYKLGMLRHLWVHPRIVPLHTELQHSDLIKPLLLIKEMLSIRDYFLLSILHNKIKAQLFKLKCSDYVSICDFFDMPKIYYSD